MSWALHQGPHESDLNFATRRLKTVGMWSLAAAIAWLLWWPAFPAIDGFGTGVFILSGMVTGLLGLVSLALVLVLFYAAVVWCWARLEIQLPSIRAHRIRLSALTERAMPLFMMLGSGYILIRAVILGEIPTVRWIHKDIAFVKDQADASALWFIWLAIFIVGFIWFLARLGTKRNDG